MSKNGMLSRYTCRAILLAIAVMLAGCVGTTSVVNSEVKRDKVTPLKTVVVITDLNLILDQDLFDSFWAQTSRELEKRGVQVTLLTMPAAESVAEKPDVKGIVAKIGADHVLSIFRGRDTENLGGWSGDKHYVTQLDVIATVTDTTTHERVWGTKFDYKLGGTLLPADSRAKGLLDVIIAELGKTGFLV
jgi:hypothetical protein